VLGRSLRASRAGIWDQPGQLLFRHVLPVAANSRHLASGIFTGRACLVDALIRLLRMPGLGPLILEATLSRDLYLVIGGIMFSALFMVVGTWLRT